MEAFQWALLLVLWIIVVFGAVSLVQLWIELKAMKSSTHTLTYIDPLQQTFGKAPDKKTTETMDTEGDLGNIAMDMGVDL